MKHFSDIGAAVIRLIPDRFSSDAAFERAAGLPPKTVSNWRRGRSATYMKMLPQLERLLGEEFSTILHETPVGSTLTREEERLLRAWRSTADLSPEARKSLLTTVLNIMKLPVGGKSK